MTRAALPVASKRACAAMVSRPHPVFAEQQRPHDALCSYFQYGVSAEETGR
jgi:hypothetical protein